MIHVCSLARLHETVDDSGARHVVTLIGDASRVTRPERIAPENHLLLHMHDIAAPLDGFITPSEDHIGLLVSFVQRWERTTPLVMHCFAGISRSTAAAFTAICALNPHRNELDIARHLRRVSPTATPNRLIVAHADQALRRHGRMVAAVDAIGRGAEAAECVPFRLDLE